MFLVEGQRFGSVSVTTLPNPSKPKWPEDACVMEYCYFCQCESTLHRCNDFSYKEERYVFLPNGVIQLVCDRHHFRVNKRDRNVPEPTTSLSEIFATKASA